MLEPILDLQGIHIFHQPYEGDLEGKEKHTHLMLEPILDLQGIHNLLLFVFY
jgi:hypothetical protein